MTMPANTQIDDKQKMVHKYLRRAWLENLLLRDLWAINAYDSDVLNGWDNPSKKIPDHLTGDRHANYLAGQQARKLRNKDKITIISAQDKEHGERWGVVKKGYLSHKRIVKICEKAGYLHNIQVTTRDRATGKETTRNIGY